MKHALLFPATLVVLVVSGIHAAAALENRAESPGPLKRHDPNQPPPEFIVKIHGDPAKGLPEVAGHRVQRVNDKTWYLEMGQRIARMEPDIATGLVAFHEIIEAGGEWAVSADGKWIFAERDQARGPKVSECFDLETGGSKWALEAGTNVMDVCFTPDGKQVVVLHTLPRPRQTPPAPAEAVVSWYDTASGEMTRRVNLPGRGATRGLGSEYLSFSRNFLYVARPCDGEAAECLFIKDGAAEPVKVDAGAAGQSSGPQVSVGGKFGEFVVFYSDNNAGLFRRDKEGALTKIREVEMESSPEGDSYSWSARFTPDGTHLVLSSCGKTIFVPTRESGGGKLKEQTGGSHLADYSGDGKFFVTFDDGGGRVRNASTWEKVESLETRMRPPHCCPITEAGFSFFDNYIISCDDVRLLLWSKDGVQLAELYSARSDDKQAVKMQSPVVVEKEGKIYGADGYDFLVWDLNALNARLSRKPDNIPRVKGEVVFNDRERKVTSPELMNIRLDAQGENIITATRSVVLYRPLAASTPVTVPVPKNDIFMKPRAFMNGLSPSTVIVRPGMSAYSLDLTGENPSVRLGGEFVGTYKEDNADFAITAGNPQGIGSRPLANPQDPSIRSTPMAKFPSGWNMRPEFAAVSPDGKWVAAVPTVWGKGSVIAVVDVAKKELIRSIPVSWTATTVSLSSDGKRLLVGSTNRAVYEFDFLKMTGQQ